MKKTNKIKIPRLFASAILILGFIYSSIPVSAISNKILVTDTDNDGSISIGDEFCLDEECFYVTENKEGMIHALAKYNLYAGYNLVKVDDEFMNALSSDRYGTLLEKGYRNCIYNSRYDMSYCLDPIDYSIFNNTEMLGNHTYEEIENNCFNHKYDGSEYIDSVMYYNVTSCAAIRYNHNSLKQSSEAISKHGGSRETGSEYPEIGDYFFNGLTNIYDGEQAYNNGFTMEFNSDGELTTDNFIYKYLDNYKTTLNATGKGNVSSVDLLTYNNLADILTNINSDGKEFKHNGYFCDGEWINNDDGSWSCSDTDYPYEWTIEEENTLVYVGRSGIKQYIPEQYNWLYSTTYWLGTAFYNFNGGPYSLYNNYQFFIDTIGDLCYVDGDEGCRGDEIGAGIRPVISMTSDQFELNRMDINGTVRWVDNNNASRIRPLRSTIKLYRNNELVDSVEVEKDQEEDLWRFSFFNLPKYDTNGVEYVYSITQDDIAQYASDITNFDVVNQYAPDASDSDPTSDQSNPAVPNTGSNQNSQATANLDAGLMSLMACTCIMIIIGVSTIKLSRKSKK